MTLNLDLNESIELKISKKKNLPLRNEDWIKIPFFMFFSSIFYFIATEILLDKSSKGLKLYIFFFLSLYFFLIFTMIKNYYKRYLVAFKWEYILTNRRLIIINHKNQIENSFYYDNFPKIELEQYALGNDYIIIGEKDSILAESRSPISYRVGINFSENDFTLYNIENVKAIYNLLKSKVINYTVE